MKINYYKINPGGNITAIVKSNFNKTRRIRIAKRILAEDQEIEQVGFWVKPKGKISLARLEMMGGEFCGNALRSLAYLIGKGANKEFLLESSGRNKQIKAAVADKYSEIILPIKDFSYKKIRNLTLIKMSGISFILTYGKIDKNSAKKILIKNKLLTEKAAGVVSVKKIKNKIYINPIVWVRDTETLYEETACASGTLAVAYFLSLKEKQIVFNIVQPSRSIFKVRISELSISLGGPVNYAVFLGRSSNIFDENPEN